MQKTDAIIPSFFYIAILISLGIHLGLLELTQYWFSSDVVPKNRKLYLKFVESATTPFSSSPLFQSRPLVQKNPILPPRQENIQLESEPEIKVEPVATVMNRELEVPSPQPIQPPGRKMAFEHLPEQPFKPVPTPTIQMTEEYSLEPCPLLFVSQPSCNKTNVLKTDKAPCARKPSTATDVEPTFTPPVVQSIPQVVYPWLSRLRGEEGTVVLQVEVLPSGKTGNVTVLTSSGYKRLDNAACRAVREASFQPAQLAGKAVSSHKKIVYHFRLNARSRDQATSSSRGLRSEGP
ncbi:MAG: energy transducer TonB [Lentisphaerae bacterium]|nr:MAG: energy transducer TonB [Lentisphaerota bacterium]